MKLLADLWILKKRVIACFSLLLRSYPLQYRRRPGLV
jgi:hypothetical protein